MYKGGRPTSSAWQYFYKIENEETRGKSVKKVVQAKCKRCGHIQSNKAERMLKHAESCFNLTNDYETCTNKDQEEEKLTGNTISDNDLSICESATATASTSEFNEMSNTTSEAQTETNNSTDEAVQPKKLRMSDLHTFVVKTDGKLKHDTDLQVANYFYANNISFSTAEHPEFVKMITMLRPGYAPPSRKALASPLLTETTEVLQDEMRIKLFGKDCTLIEDGWSNIHNDPVSAMRLHVENEAFFLEAVDTTSNKKTAEYCKSLVQNAMKSAEEKYGCHVRNVVTDNAKSMAKMRTLLKEDDEDLIVNGSSSPVLTATPRSYRKGQNSTPCKIKTPERIRMKFCTVDYVLEIRPQNKFGDDRSSGGFWVNM